MLESRGASCPSAGYHPADRLETTQRACNPRACSDPRGLFELRPRRLKTIAARWPGTIPLAGSFLPSKSAALKRIEINYEVDEFKFLLGGGVSCILPSFLPSKSAALSVCFVFVCFPPIRSSSNAERAISVQPIITVLRHHCCAALLSVQRWKPNLA